MPIPGQSLSLESSGSFGYDGGLRFDGSELSIDGNLFGGLMMSRITLAVTICVVLTRTAAPCCAELFSVEVPDMEGFYGGIGGQNH